MKEDASDFEVAFLGCATAGPTLGEARQAKALVVEVDWATTNRIWFLAGAARPKLRDAV